MEAGEEAGCDPRIGRPDPKAEKEVSARWKRTLQQRTEAILAHLGRHKLHALVALPSADGKQAGKAVGWRLHAQQPKGGVEVTVKHSATGKVLVSARIAFKHGSFQDGGVGHAEAWLSEPLGILLIKAGAFDPSQDVYEHQYRIIRIQK